EQLQQQLEVRTQEQRAVYALASSSQPWLKVECPTPKGQLAQVWLNATVPDEPGETLEARVVVQANGNQRFVVPVTLAVSGTRRPRPPIQPARFGSDGIPIAIPVAPPPVMPADTVVPRPIPATTSAPPANGRPVPVAVQEGVAGPRQKKRHLVPAALLVIVLVGMFCRDTFFNPGRDSSGKGEDEAQLIDTVPRLSLHMHDRPDPQGREAAFDHPSMRFGLVSDDPRSPGPPKRLTYDEQGRSNNTCVRLDDNEYLF